jgi:HSP20 family protein
MQTNAQNQGAAAPQKPRQATTAPETVLTPPIDVFEGNDSILVVVDLPGVKPEELALQIDKGVLTLTAPRTDALLESPHTYKRSFVLPRDVDADAIDAKLDRGVLALTLPRRAESKPKTVRVNARSA